MCPLENDSGLALSNGTEFLAVQPTTPVRRNKIKKFYGKYQALNYLQAAEAMASVALGVGLGAPFNSFPLTLRFSNESAL